MRFYSLQISDIKKETSDTVSIAFSVPDILKKEFRFIPGQYLTLRADIGGEDVRRAYSICSAPHENELRVAIKQVPNGKFSTFANTQLKTGDSLEVMTPIGQFFCDYSTPKNYVGFAAGSGITPIISIIKHVLYSDTQSTFTLFYGNREVDSVIFGKEIDTIKNKYPARFSVHFIFSRENHGTEIFYGRIDTGKLQVWEKGLFDTKKTDEFFMCGPEGMTNDIREYLRTRDVDESKIHFELFTTSGTENTQKSSGSNASETEVHANVKVIIDDEEYEFELDSNGPDILNAGIDAGIDLPFSCKGGVCSTCKAKVLEGEVAMKLNYSLLSEEVAAGYILTCQSHPKSKNLIVSFDD